MVKRKKARYKREYTLIQLTKVSKWERELIMILEIRTAGGFEEEGLEMWLGLAWGSLGGAVLIFYFQIWVVVT